jgi:hypothetical protein
MMSPPSRRTGAVIWRTLRADGGSLHRLLEPGVGDAEQRTASNEPRSGACYGRSGGSGEHGGEPVFIVLGGGVEIHGQFSGCCSCK